VSSSVLLSDGPTPLAEVEPFFFFLNKKASEYSEMLTWSHQPSRIYLYLGIEEGERERERE
jgi:hypothetical protein